MIIDIPTGKAVDGWRVEKRGGTHRFVRVVPTPFGERPCIWTSQEAALDAEGVLSYTAIVLVSRVPAETMRITIPCEIWDQLPTAPVEW